MREEFLLSVTEEKMGSKKAELWAIGLVIIATLIGSIGPILMKLSTKHEKFSIIGMIKNPKVILGAGAMFVSVLVYKLALKGGELSVLYPFASLNYLWITLISKFYLKEQINKQKIIGISLIILGIILIGLN